MDIEIEVSYIPDRVKFAHIILCVSKLRVFTIDSVRECATEEIPVSEKSVRAVMHGLKALGYVTFNGFTHRWHVQRGFPPVGGFEDATKIADAILSLNPL